MKQQSSLFEVIPTKLQACKLLVARGGILFTSLLRLGRCKRFLDSPAKGGFARNDEGQMMIEVLIAFILLAFLLTGIILVGLFAIKNTIYSKNKSAATKLATEQIERVRVVRDTAGINALVAMCAPNPCYIPINLTPVAGPVTLGVFSQYVWYVTPTSGAECPTPPGAVNVTTYKARVDVRWDTIPNATPPRQVELNSCFSNWR